MRKIDRTANFGDGLAYEETPPNTRKGGKGAKMPNTNKTEAVKASKKYAKTRGEHYKDIVIAVLVTAVVAFIAGAHYANNQHAATDQAVKAATVQTEAVKK